MVSSVEEKIKMMMTEPITKKDNNKIIKRIGVSNGEIKRLGVSNQKIRRRL